MSFPMGIILAIASVVLATSSSIKNASVFVSWHAAVIVIGGTLAAALVCFSIRELMHLGNLIVAVALGRTRKDMTSAIEEIVRISEALQKGEQFSASLETVENPFFREALELMNDASLSRDEIIEVLEKRVQMQNDRYVEDGRTFKTLGKFPPAFGLVGTTIGMIALLQGIGGQNAFESLGPSMSTALVATFYGLILANVFLIPMGENLNKATQEDLALRQMIVDGVRLIQARRHPILVREYLNSYLKPGRRASQSDNHQEAA